MSSAPNNSAASSVPEGQPLRNSAGPQLPEETILQVLELLPQKDLWAVASASREFNAYAHEAGLYIHRTIVLQHILGYGEQRSQLDQIVEHAAANRPDLSISIHVLYESSWTDIPASVPDGFVASLQRALPNVIQLRFSFKEMCPEEVPATHMLYEHPAPKLRDLTVSIDCDCAQPLPAVMFADNAPLLRKVVLQLPKIKSTSAWTPISAFRGVTHLKLEANCLANTLSLAPLFPAVRVLALWMVGEQGVDIRGLQLHHLEIEFHPDVATNASSDPLADIRVIRIQYPVYDPATGTAEPVWHPRCDALCAVVQRRHFGPLSISFGPRDGAWQRTMRRPFFSVEDPLPLAVLPRMTAALSSLTIDNTLFGMLARAPVTLPALRELFVDMVLRREALPYGWKDEQLQAFLNEKYAAVTQATFPAIERVVLYALPATDPVTVLPERVVQIGIALGGRKPTLTLAGCIWNPAYQPPEGTEIPHLFSAVEVMEYSGAMMPAYYEAYRCSAHSCWRTTEWDPANFE